MVKPSQRKEMAKAVLKTQKISIRLICEIFGISKTAFHYQAKTASENKLIETWLLKLTQTHKRWGFSLCFNYLRNIQKFPWNHKRVLRIYWELELNLRIKPKKSLVMNCALDGKLTREADENITQLSVEYAKAQERVRNTHLTAPVSGTVQEVTVHTEGGVITQAEPLMMIVPEEDYLEVEALVPNKDIGFIEEGQAVVIKIESFPYTRYGYLTGTVKSVSLDAIEHEQLGLVFQAMVQVDQDTPFMVEGKAIQLSAGMNVTAEIKIGERRVISYFLSPLQTKIEESLREK